MGQTIGIFGSGYADPQAVRDTLESVVDDSTRIIFALGERHWTPTMKVVYSFLIDLCDLEYEVVVDESSFKVDELHPVIQGAARVYKVQRLPHKVVNLLTKAADCVSLFVLWNDEDAENMTALERAVDKDIPAFDLTKDLEPLEFVDSDPPALGLANLLAVAKPDESDDDEVYDEGILIVMTKDEFIELLEQTIVNALRRFRTEG